MSNSYREFKNVIKYDKEILTQCIHKGHKYGGGLQATMANGKTIEAKA